MALKTLKELENEAQEKADQATEARKLYEAAKKKEVEKKEAAQKAKAKKDQKAKIDRQAKLDKVLVDFGDLVQKPKVAVSKPLADQTKPKKEVADLSEEADLKKKTLIDGLIGN